MPLSDTTPDAEAVQLAAYRRLSPEQKLTLAMRASEAARDLALAGIRREHPDWPESELKREFLRRQFPADQIPPPLR